MTNGPDPVAAWRAWEAFERELRAVGIAALVRSMPGRDTGPEEFRQRVLDLAHAAALWEDAARQLVSEP